MTPDTHATPAEVARRYCELIQVRDMKAAAALWEPGGMDRFVGIIDLRAPDEVDAYFVEVFAAVPDIAWDILSVTGDEERAAVHWRMYGTFDGTGHLMGMAPNGRSFDVQGVDLISVSDGRIVGNIVNTNAFALARELAIMPPQDSRLERVMYALVNAIAPVAKAIRGRRRARSTQ